MQNGRRFLSMVALAASIGFLGACSTGESPTAPDIPVATTPVVANPVPATSPVPEAVPEPATGEDAKAVMELVAFSYSEGTATIKNNGSQPHWGGLAVYRLNGTVYDQTLLDEDFIEIPANRQRSFKVDVPDPADGCLKVQYDAVVGLKQALRDTFPNYSGSNLLDLTRFGGHFWNFGNCTPPTPPPPPTYDLAVTKVVKQKGCAPAGQNAPVSFDIGVTNLSSGSVTINVSDPAATECNRTLTLGASQNSTYTCSGGFASGQRSNTVTASIAGQSVSKTATVNFTVDTCTDTCDNYPAPTITGAPAVAINPTTVTVTAGSVAPTGGTFTPALPLTVDRPPFNQPAGSWNTTYSLPYGPPALHCSVSKPYSGPVPPKDPPGDPCEGVGNPSFTFTKNETTHAATVTSSLTFPGGFTGSIDIAPPPVSGFPGGTVTSGTNNVSNYNRPDWNQSPLTVNGSWQVRKNETVCKSGSKSVTIDPECRTCTDVKPKVACQVSGNNAQCTATWFNPGSGMMKLDSGSWQAVSNGETLPYRELTPGNHTVKLKVQDGNLNCEDTDTFTIVVTGCLAVPATSTAAQPFGLPNSNPVTETNWVNANVDPGPYAFSHKDENGGPSCKAAGSSAKVVLLKAGQNYWYFLNVTQGQQLCSSGQGISHLSYFVCAN